MRRTVFFCVLLSAAVLCVLISAPVTLVAQSTSGLINGLVTDPSGAAVPNATLTLTNIKAGTTQVTTSDAAGRYLFPAVEAGDYSMKVEAKGFQTHVVNQIHVDPTKSYDINVSLQIGATTQTVEVIVAPGAELQTTNASIGTEIEGETMLRLPSQQRSVTAFLGLQPNVSPMNPGGQYSGCDINGGQVAGAEPDQTTFLVDGGDATSDLEGTNGYVAPPGEPLPAPFIAVPVESTQEFRVVTAMPTASFARSQGGEISVLTKAGTNVIHGSAYEYYYGNATQGNHWELNAAGQKQAHSVNNRFGASLGGPIKKNKLFVYGNYEGRRFYQNASITTSVPSDSVRMGILRFPDNAGNVISYNLNPANGAIATCSTGALCDPRTTFPAGFGPGLDPTIQAYWALLPKGNSNAAGDGLNSIGFVHSFATPVIEDLAVGRLDYELSSRWHIFGTYHYNRYRIADTSQINLISLKGISGTPVEPRFVTFMLTGQIGSHLTTQTHGSFMRDWWSWSRIAPAPLVPGTDAALQVSGEKATGLPGLITVDGITNAFADPINFNTQQARGRLWAGKDWYAAEDMSWLRGTHTVQFGGSWYFWNLTHLRTDNVVGGLTSAPIYWVGQTFANGGAALQIPGSQEPTVCATATSANCIQGTSLSTWDSMFSSILGLVDRSSQVGTRNGLFKANPLGSPLIDHVHSQTFQTYIQDSWKVKPSVTLTYGLSYGVQFPPHELDGKQVLEVFTNSGRPLQDLNAFFQQRNSALVNGGFFASGATPSTDATFGFAPVHSISGVNSAFTTSWNNFGPRVAVAWNLPFNNRIFGNKQTVIRAGYSILWNRQSAVNQALTPLLGDGLAQILECAGPVNATMSTQAVATCSNGSTDAANAYRIGIDGHTVPVPAVTNAPIPLIPASPNGLRSSSAFDPAATPPYSHNVSFDVQRAFAPNWYIDVGFVGRFARNLLQNVDLNASDPFARDPVSGQTLAQAFDGLALQLRTGNPFDKNGNFIGTVEPFFEDAPYGAPGNSAFMASAASSFLINGDLSRFMSIYNRFAAPQPLDPLQCRSCNWTTDGGRSNYSALFASVRKSLSQGLDVSANYTWSHNISYGGINQQYVFYSVPNAFDFRSGYASAPGDRRHVLNVTAYYQLPFGKGRRFSTNSFVDRIIGGWYASGIYQLQSGLPLCVFSHGNYGTRNSTLSLCAVSSTNFYGATGRHSGVPVPTSGVNSAGNGLNLFANPAAVFATFSQPLLSQDGRPFQDAFSEPRSYNLDLAFGKNILSTERYKMVFSAELFNAFNHPILSCATTVSTDLTDPAHFGALTAQCNNPRVINLGLRFEF